VVCRVDLAALVMCPNLVVRIGRRPSVACRLFLSWGARPMGSEIGLTSLPPTTRGTSTVPRFCNASRAVVSPSLWADPLA